MENHMNKDKILLKSRNENSYGDELDKSNKEKSTNLGYMAVEICFFVLWMLAEAGVIQGSITIFRYEVLFKDLCSSVIALGFLVEFSYKYYYLRKKRYILYMLFWLIALLFDIYIMLI